ncbi:MAG: rifamycin-inactivating phosphotransferase [Acidimicrobiales bacterium]
MASQVLELGRVDSTMTSTVGGKAANLGELTRIDGICVPPGVCVTTDVYRDVVRADPTVADLLHRLDLVDPADRQATESLAGELRARIERLAIPDDVAEAIADAIGGLGPEAAYAVRSSATAEDLPTTSFAGQHDSYLEVLGVDEILRHVGRCWASLFTDRAVAYRARNHIDHRQVAMAVIVQRMAAPSASGVLFTADPISSNRTVAAVDAVPGLGEALVSGTETPDSFRVRNGQVIGREIATNRSSLPALTDEQAVRLVDLGRRIEAHFGRPQDIEWCLVDGEFVVVQSRPITTLFPVPTLDDGHTHVYISVGHQQMMTDALRPLGISMWQLTAGPPMYEAGGRLFVDIAARLASPEARGPLVAMLSTDPLIGAALHEIVERDDIMDALPAPALVPAPLAAAQAMPPIEPDRSIVTALVAEAEASNAAAREQIGGRTGTDLLETIRADIGELKRLLFDPRSHQVFLSAMDATAWLNTNLEEWLGEKNVADTLTLSVPDNVTSEMGLALLDVADAIRPHPQVIAHLESLTDDDTLDGLPALEGGKEAKDALDAFLDRFGMRCVGEIDVTRPRWVERPATLVPLILGNVRNAEPGSGPRRFAEGRVTAEAKAEEVLARLRALPDGDAKADGTAHKIELVRSFIGYREYPKYFMISRYFVYRQALLGEAARLTDAGVLRDADDAAYLRFEELEAIAAGGPLDTALVDARRAAFRDHQHLTPPRVLTSDGEVFHGAHRRDDVPDGALAGLAVSSGLVEGRARVVHDLAAANLEPGDILVTAFTDPSWSALFLSIAGLVTEVGAAMSHGSVVAREYGLPAVVGVEGATTRIRDGQRIRGDGTHGFVELLD